MNVASIEHESSDLQKIMIIINDAVKLYTAL